MYLHLCHIRARRKNRHPTLESIFPAPTTRYPLGSECVLHPICLAREAIPRGRVSNARGSRRIKRAPAGEAGNEAGVANLGRQIRAEVRFTEIFTEVTNSSIYISDKPGNSIYISITTSSIPSTFLGIAVC